jgi:hypothetical protein
MTTELELRDWVIYVLRDPRDGSPRYVGFTRKAIAQRLRAHVLKANQIGRHYEYPTYRWIRKLESLSLVPLIEEIERGTGDWEKREQFHIERLRGDGCELHNVALGGHFNLPPESRRKAGEKLKGRIFSDEHRRRISEAKIRAKTKRPDILDRNRRSGEWLRGKRLDISPEERVRRAGSARQLSGRGHWINRATDKQKIDFAAAQAERTRASWISRREKSNA